MNRLSFIIICCFTTAISSLSKAQNAGTHLFNNEALHQIQFTSNTIPDKQLWDSLSTNYKMVTITIDRVTIDSIGVRFKGFTSAGSAQKPLKIDINRYKEKQEYDGLKKFNLHNNFTDEFLQRERLAYELYRRAGLPSIRTAYAEVFMGDQFVGLYEIAEQIDQDFLKQNYPSNKGSLLKAQLGFVGISMDTKQGTTLEYDAFKQNVTAQNIGEYVNLRNYIKQMAVDVLIEDWDGYAFRRHNFYIYHETKSGLLNFINYDHNYAFGVEEPNRFLYPTGTLPTAVSLLNDPALKALYEQTLCELNTYLFDPDFIEELILHNYAITSSNEHRVEVEDPNELIKYIQNRKSWIQDTLAKIGVSCEAISTPVEQGELVINEFVAYSDSTGVQEPNGGTPDWIELYNNSTSNILLDQNYYLSDDKNFLKKWHFPNDTIIKASEYIVIWADKDIHQNGIHAGFKIEKNKGSLFLSYEDETIIDAVHYEAQSLNLSNARKPNGIGDFETGLPTFFQNNELISGLKNLEANGLILFPNPSTGEFTINSDALIAKLSIATMDGKVIKTLNNSTSPIVINNLQPGVYLVSIQSEETSNIIKVVVQ